MLSPLWQDNREQACSRMVETASPVPMAAKPVPASEPAPPQSEKSEDELLFQLGNALIIAHEGNTTSHCNIQAQVDCCDQ
jgi:hypothetical protein